MDRAATPRFRVDARTTPSAMPARPEAQNRVRVRSATSMLDRRRHEQGEAGILFRLVARHARLQARRPICDSRRTVLGDRDSRASQDTCLATRT